MRRSSTRLPHSSLLAFVFALALLPPGSVAAQETPVRVFISVDMEGLGGIGTAEMTSAGSKDYDVGRRLATEEVNAVVEAIYARGPAEVLVNDSHGDMQNLLLEHLDARVTYIQGSIKPYGMVEGLDSTFDAAIFLGYHSRAGAEVFLAHTGSSARIRLNGTEVGEGGLNAAYAGELGVPVVLASGDSAFAAQFARLVPTTTVVTKTAVTPRSARLRHPEQVRAELRLATDRALAGLRAARPWSVGSPVRVRVGYVDTTRPLIAEGIPGVVRVDPNTVEFTARGMREAYRLIRVLYKFLDV